jgi:Protein of unknown function (DUF2934)
MDETRKPARKPRAPVAAKPVAKTAAKPVKEPVSRKAPAAGKTGLGQKTVPARPSAAEREALIRMAAYYRAQRRGFKPGHEWDDWLAAEAEVAASTDAAPEPQPRKAAVRKGREG